MKILNILILVLTLIMVKIDFNYAQTSPVKNISVAEFEGLMKNKGAVRVLDVRSPGEVSEGHLIGAINMDFQNENFKTEIAKLDKKRTYLVYCKAGTRSDQAAKLMKKAGFTHVYALEGGIDAWKEADKPIEK
ncbi:rhodanese-related sulfurtransferase [Algoriphagus ratkowskyi]|uniref:Rhodanese-like domain-containing protein n=1 Tax=Algoriphagus ratkowskyi TaxID=57028 RepID=A0A2W7SBZ4_9BACT|nr:rhodanese-like domain-containing protein [Algoriphagus ratkowskyi]PZX60385.1 rhodanese-related sulfurtransferase [Algoriphagus ratkowskyi]TXD78197.1 rhodanese-like domain-containing protein [Algoriphagus ratkowskyi]